MTNLTQPTADAEITAPISADLRGLPALSEQDAGLLEQAASMLEGLQNDERNRGNCSTAEGAACSADAVRRLAVQLLRAAPPAPAAANYSGFLNGCEGGPLTAGGVPVLYVSPEQFAHHRDPEGDDSAEAGRYLPARKTPAGKFTQPLYALAAAPAQPDLRKHLRWALHLLRNDEGGCCGQRHSEAVHALERADAVAAWSQESAAPAQAVAVPADDLDWALQEAEVRGLICDPPTAPAPAQEHATQLAGPVQWRSIETAPNDGTLLRLLVEFETGNLEDDDKPQATIGHNSFANTGVDEWQFSGWSWTHDCFVQGTGRVVGWLPLLDGAAPAQAQEDARDADLPESVTDAVAAALGDAYDCTRTWSAWGVGTMSQDDFTPVAEDGDRVNEIARAAIDAARAAQGSA